MKKLIEYIELLLAMAIGHSDADEVFEPEQEGDYSALLVEDIENNS